MNGEVKLGGRLFNVVNYDAIIVLNEHYVMKFMRGTGLDRIMPTIDGETNEAYLLRLNSSIVDTLRLPELLAGYLLPMGKTESDWTLDMAIDTAKHISHLTDKEDKAEVHRLGMMVTLDFFRAGVDSLNHSLNASKPAPATNRSNQTAAH